MKKRLYVLAFSLFSYVAVNAQENLIGDLSPLKGVHRINVIIDWSKVKIEEKTVDIWMRNRQEEKPNYNSSDELEMQIKPQLTMNLIPECNKNTKKRNFMLVRKEGTKLSLRIIPLAISKNNSSIMYEFFYASSDKVFASFLINTTAFLNSINTLPTAIGKQLKSNGAKLGNFLKEINDNYKW